MSTFSLHALVLEVCATSHAAEPTMLAKEANRRINRRECDAALEQALPTYVQKVLGQMRSQTSPPRTAPSASPRNPSQKVQGVRNTWRWRDMLNDRINVGPEHGDWRFLRDCTAEHLEYAAQIREDLARRNAARAAQYRQLEELLTVHGVAVVGALPGAVLDGVPGGDGE